MILALVSPSFRSRMILSFLGDVPRAIKLLRTIGLTPIGGDRFHEIILPNLSLDAERGDDDHLLHRPVESLDAIRNSATMKGVPGRSNRL
jgi:hypothetical protein